jgi:ribosomal protein S30
MKGSITKNGKVRKQTPKVEKKESLIKDTVGRSKKRCQYNKRFKVLSLEGEGKIIKFQPNKQKV